MIPHIVLPTVEACGALFLITRCILWKGHYPLRIIAALTAISACTASALGFYLLNQARVITNQDYLSLSQMANHLNYAFIEHVKTFNQGILVGLLIALVSLGRDILDVKKTLA